MKHRTVRRVSGTKVILLGTACFFILISVLLFTRSRSCSEQLQIEKSVATKQREESDLQIAQLEDEVKTLKEALEQREESWRQAQEVIETLQMEGSKQDRTPPSQPSHENQTPTQQRPATTTTTPVVARPGTTTGQVPDVNPTKIAILVFCYNRPNYLSRALESIVKNRPSGGFPIIVSQDGGNTEVSDVIEKFAQQHRDVFHLKHVQSSPPAGFMYSAAYYAIADHYRWALEQVFGMSSQYSHVVILEEDIEVSPDFYSYFHSTAGLLDVDPTLLCVSAWNDQGQAKFVRDPAALYRSDFFPGLGWMLNRKMWSELGSKWPEGFWDDWLREPPQRKGRACIRPEISRTFTFGKEGASQGMFFDRYLNTIKLNDEPVVFEDMDLSFLIKENYDGPFIDRVRSAHQTTLQAVHALSFDPTGAQDFVLYYGSEPEYVSIAQSLGLIDDTKAGVPRGAYLGVVTIRFQGHTVFISPQDVSPLTYSNVF